MKYSLTFLSLFTAVLSLSTAAQAQTSEAVVYRCEASTIDSYRIVANDFVLDNPISVENVDVVVGAPAKIISVPMSGFPKAGVVIQAQISGPKSGAYAGQIAIIAYFYRDLSVRPADGSGPFYASVSGNGLPGSPAIGSISEINKARTFLDCKLQ